MGATRKQSTCGPVASRTFSSTLSRSLECCECATNLTVRRLLTMSPPRILKPFWKEKLRWPSVTNPNARLAAKKMNSFYTSYCVNKTIK
ncbi:unnamed protein product [Gulo gulo]|uniref:Uncharacterized protein n=1 Tax=Gulo gulo TaxID=48420 RepID=A0A9X9Q4F6_GULGU|nr:unnamed protein product [Gulo gulo]